MADSLRELKNIQKHSKNNFNLVGGSR